MKTIRDIIITRLINIGRYRLAKESGLFWSLSTEIMELYPPFTVHRSQVMLLIASCMGEAFPREISMEELEAEPDNAQSE